MPDRPASLEAGVPADAPQYQVAAARPGRTAAIAAAAFLLSLACFMGFGAAYWVNARSEILGATLGAGLTLAGFGLVAWGKYLMPRGPFVEERHRLTPTREEKAKIVGEFSARGKVAVERRTFLGKILGAAIGIFSIVALFPLLRSLGPLPKDTFYHTKWRKGAALTRLNGTAVNIGDLQVGSVVTVFPPDDIGGAISQTILIRASASELAPTMPGRDGWTPNGYYAYSKVCTHAGCPVALYQHITQQLLCPCHQSLFDILNGAEPVFGPAPRPLPQLPLYADAAGTLRAQADYDEPIGPGFWERGND